MGKTLEKRQKLIPLSDISKIKRPGRPPSKEEITSKATNYQSLAWQVKQRIEYAEQHGKKLMLKKAVKIEMLESVKKRNEQWNQSSQWKPVSEELVNIRLETVYTEVRKILAKWRKAGKN